MKVDPEFSRKILALSIIATIAVVFIHSTAYLTLASPARWNVFAEMMVTRSFSRWAVPFFFVVSGFWFGRSGFFSGAESYCALLLKKGRTLLIPYLCWCALGLVIALPLLVGNNALTGKGIWERTLFDIPGTWEKIDSFLGLTKAGPKGNMPLWFVRSLLVLFLLGPIWRTVMRFSFGRWMLLAFSVITLFVKPIGIPCLSVPHWAFGWFSMGIVLANSNVEEWHVKGPVFYLSALAYAAASISLSMIVAGYWQWGGGAVLSERLEYSIIPLFGIVTMWGFYDRFPVLQTCALPWCVRQTFFVYCLQEIICGYFTSSSRYLFGKTDVVTCVLACAVPWLAWSTCMILACFLHKMTPKSYGIITGGR